MGDTGSLALGGALGAVAILLKSEFVLAFVGAVFVAEMMSVILQRSVFKYRLKRYGLRVRAEAHRVFRRAPLHHHFEDDGLEGVAGRRALLDHRDSVRVLRAEHAQASLSMARVSEPAMRREWLAARSRSSVSRAAAAPRRGCSRAPVRRSTRRTSGTSPELETTAAELRRGRHRRRAGRPRPRADRAQRRSSSRVPAFRPTRRRSSRRATRACRSSARSRSACDSCPRSTYIAITGTNGKTTTTALIGHLLKSLGRRAVDGGQHRHAARRARAVADAAGLGGARGVVVPAARHAEHQSARRRADEPVGEPSRPVRRASTSTSPTRRCSSATRRRRRTG